MMVMAETGEVALDTRFVGYGGNYWGTMTQIGIYPGQDVVVVILSNNDASGGEAVRSWTHRTLTASEKSLAASSSALSRRP
jgi:hypothetical protein